MHIYTSFIPPCFYQQMVLDSLLYSVYYTSFNKIIIIIVESPLDELE